MLSNGEPFGADSGIGLAESVHGDAVFSGDTPVGISGSDEMSGVFRLRGSFRFRLQGSGKSFFKFSAKLSDDEAQFGDIAFYPVKPRRIICMC